MYEKSVGAGASIAGAGGLAYTGVSGVGWLIVAGAVLILLGVAFYRLVPKLNRKGD